MLLSCKETTRLLSQGEDRKLAFGERVALRVHLAICNGCRNVNAQFNGSRKKSECSETPAPIAGWRSCRIPIGPPINPMRLSPAHRHSNESGPSCAGSVIDTNFS